MPIERPKEFPHVQSAFVNAVTEEGTKKEACDWLQKLWNELRWWEKKADALQEQNERLAAALRTCALELRDELDARYASPVDRYPTEARRYAKDVESVRQAWALLHSMGYEFPWATPPKTKRQP